MQGLFMILSDKKFHEFQHKNMIAFYRKGLFFPHICDTIKEKDRLNREKRVGTVEKIDEHTYRFSADVYDIGEMVPWIRTFICRIKEINFSNRELEKKFKEDIDAMYKMYGVDKGEDI